MSVVNFKYRYIFFHEPHVGGRSITKALMQHELSDNFNGDHHLSASNMIHGGYVTPEQFHRFTKFRFVRDPLDYLITAWLVYNKKRTDFWTWVNGPGLTHMLNGTLFWRYDQCADYDLRYESLQADLNKVLEDCGAPLAELSHVGKTKDKENFPSHLYSLHRLRELYPDFDRFGY